MAASDCYTDLQLYGNQLLRPRLQVIDDQPILTDIAGDKRGLIWYRLLGGVNQTSGARINYHTHSNGDVAGMAQIPRVDADADTQMVYNSWTFLNSQPFSVHSNTRVINLNADLLDGHDSAATPLNDTIPIRQPIVAGDAKTEGRVKVGWPVDPDDATPKNYTDSMAAGLNVMAAVRVASTAALGGTFNGAGTGVITGPQAVLVIDGVTMVLGNRVLVKNEANLLRVPSTGTQSEANGIYTVTRLGVAGTTTWELTRASDADQDAELPNGSYVFIDEGTENLNQSFVLRWYSSGTGTPGVPSMNVNEQQWMLFGRAGTLTQGKGIIISNNQINFATSSNYTVGSVFAASSVSAMAPIIPAGAGRFLRDGGVGVVPAWSGYALPNAAALRQLLVGTSGTAVGLVDPPAGGTVQAPVYLRWTGGTSLDWGAVPAATGDLTGGGKTFRFPFWVEPDGGFDTDNLDSKRLGDTFTVATGLPDPDDEYESFIHLYWAGVAGIGQPAVQLRGFSLMTQGDFYHPTDSRYNHAQYLGLYGQHWTNSVTNGLLVVNEAVYFPEGGVSGRIEIFNQDSPGSPGCSIELNSGHLKKQEETVPPADPTQVDDAAQITFIPHHVTGVTSNLLRMVVTKSDWRNPGTGFANHENERIQIGGAMPAGTCEVGIGYAPNVNAGDVYDKGRYGVDMVGSVRIRNHPIEPATGGGNLRVEGTLTLPTGAQAGRFLSCDGAGAASWVPSPGGTGTATRVARWNTGTSLNDSLITDTGSKIGINAAAPLAQTIMQVAGQLPVVTNGSLMLVQNSAADPDNTSTPKFLADYQYLIAGTGSGSSVRSALRAYVSVSTPGTLLGSMAMIQTLANIGTGSTVANLFGIRVDTPTVATGGTQIQNYTGIMVQGSNAVSVKGINVQTTHAVNCWAYYADGGAASYLNGNLQVGGSPNNALPDRLVASGSIKSNVEVYGRDGQAALGSTGPITGTGTTTRGAVKLLSNNGTQHAYILGPVNSGQNGLQFVVMDSTDISFGHHATDTTSYIELWKFSQFGHLVPSPATACVGLLDTPVLALYGKIFQIVQGTSEGGHLSWTNNVAIQTLLGQRGAATSATPPTSFMVGTTGGHIVNYVRAGLDSDAFAVGFSEGASPGAYPTRLGLKVTRLGTWLRGTLNVEGITTLTDVVVNNIVYPPGHVGARVIVLPLPAAGSGSPGQANLDHNLGRETVVCQARDKTTNEFISLDYRASGTMRTIASWNSLPPTCEVIVIG